MRGASSRPRATTGVLEHVLGLVVTVVTRLFRHRIAVSWAALFLTLILGASYLVFGALEINPLVSQYRVQVHLAQSGGLLAGRDVTVRGQRVGRVVSVELTAGGGVVAVAAIDGGTRISERSSVYVAALSAAGEQYLDFSPTSTRGPYLRDGSVIGTTQTSTPVTLAQLLDDLNGTIVQVDPAKIESIVHELGAGSAAPEKLASIIDGGVFLITTLGSVLPQTVSLLHNSEIVLDTVHDLGPGLRATAGELDRTLAGVEARTGGFKRLVDITPSTLTAMDQIIADNSPTMVQLLGNLVTVTQMAYLHAPAMRELFFPKQRQGSAADAVRSVFHDGGVWALASIYPRKECDYNLPNPPITEPSFPEPFLYADCDDQDPALLPRGARNAPRPPGDDTAHRPHGVDPRATADPTPHDRLSIPMPFGGAPAPSYVPPK
ncbi:MlaD family protein [Nocardia vaccinii]|uniref:MlaD family protein n=1 Tax=Nocardia vaccinii TaxID=1822 RepID=UPI000A064E38|nr:MlaD family protein [Nocardia vaccinii]